MIYLAPDANGTPTLWQEDDGLWPLPLLRETDLPPVARPLWPRIVRAVSQAEHHIGTLALDGEGNG